MQIHERIKARLKQVQDWSSVVDEIEAEIDQGGDAAAQSAEPVSYTHLTLPTTPYV